MANTDPGTVEATTLADRLRALVGDERRVQVDFLLHLDEFDRRRAFLPLGFGSLWDFCLKALHLREGPAGRRIGAMRMLRRFPRLEAPLRDGRLCLSTAPLLGQVLTNENLDALVARAAFMTKAEVEHLVASFRPRPAPGEGIRKIAASPVAAAPPFAPPEGVTAPDVWPAQGLAAPDPGAPPGADAPPAQAIAEPGLDVSAGASGGAATAMGEDGRASASPLGGGLERHRGSRSVLQPVSEDRWSLRVTLDAELKEEIEVLKALLSHKLPTGDLADVLREAVRCGIEKHGKRRGAVPPSRSREGDPPTARPAAGPRAITAAVRRHVWSRDGGRCTFQAEDGRRCESRWQLELDHVDAAALGGDATVDNLRLRCRGHNLHHAEEVFGREHMARFRRGERESQTASRPQTGEVAHPGMSRDCRGFIQGRG